MRVLCFFLPFLHTARGVCMYCALFNIFTEYQKCMHVVCFGYHFQKTVRGVFPLTRPLDITQTHKLTLQWPETTLFVSVTTSMIQQCEKWLWAFYDEPTPRVLSIMRYWTVDGRHAPLVSSTNSTRGVVIYTCMWVSPEYRQHQNNVSCFSVRIVKGSVQKMSNLCYQLNACKSHV